jgi:hypothetical protein
MTAASKHNDQPLVYIIVLNYRMKAQVIECLRSLSGISYTNHRIVVVDNGSGDGSEEAVGRAFPETALIQTRANLGYTGGNNAGIEFALENGADYLLIINPDTVVINDRFVEEMVDYAEAHPAVGIAGPRVYLRKRGEIQNTVLYAPGLRRNMVNWVRHRIDPKSLEHSADEEVEAEVLNGVCLLIRAECLRQAGMFDENIFMYIEDADMDYRVRRKGWKVVYLPIDSLIHRQKHEGYEMTGMVNFLLKRNSVYFLCKTGKSMEAWVYAIISLSLMFARGIATLSYARFVEYLAFTGKLALAYHRILLDRELDEAFGPPIGQWR